MLLLLLLLLLLPLCFLINCELDLLQRCANLCLPLHAGTDRILFFVLPSHVKLCCHYILEGMSFGEEEGREGFWEGERKASDSSCPCVLAKLYKILILNRIYANLRLSIFISTLIQFTLSLRISFPRAASLPPSASYPFHISMVLFGKLNCWTLFKYPMLLILYSFPSVPPSVRSRRSSLSTASHHLILPNIRIKSTFSLLSQIMGKFTFSNLSS